MSGSSRHRCTRTLGGRHCCTPGTLPVSGTGSVRFYEDRTGRQTSARPSGGLDIHRPRPPQSSYWGRGGGGRWSPIRDRNQPADQLLMVAPRAALATARHMVLVSTGMSLWVAPLFSLLWRPPARCRQSRSGPVPTEPGSGGDLVTAQGRTPDIDAQWRCLRGTPRPEGSQGGHAVGADHDGIVPFSGAVVQVLQPRRQGQHHCSIAGAVSPGRCLQLLLLPIPR